MPFFMADMAYMMADMAYMMADFRVENMEKVSIMSDFTHIQGFSKTTYHRMMAYMADIMAYMADIMAYMADIGPSR